MSDFKWHPFKDLDGCPCGACSLNIVTPPNSPTLSPASAPEIETISDPDPLPDAHHFWPPFIAGFSARYTFGGSWVFTETKREEE
jgi:hypothetical protein